MGMLDGKVAIVTGAGHGIGRGHALELAKHGATVVVNDLGGSVTGEGTGRDADLTVDIIKGRGGQAASNYADVSDYDQAGEMVAQAVEQFGRLDILVNNAGVGHRPQPLEALPEDEFDRIAAVNMKALYLAMREAVPRFKAQKSGVILNMASTAGVSPRPRLAWYNASKGWVITATRACAVELAPFGIRVNALNPVAGETPMLATFMGEDTPEMRAKFLATIPLGRFSTPEDLGNAACFLCSDEASMITGVCMEVDGGRCI
jgi:3-oxoacyl-[acyl-carrier protein] reductase